MICGGLFWLETNRFYQHPSRLHHGRCAAAVVRQSFKIRLNGSHMKPSVTIDKKITTHIKINAWTHVDILHIISTVYQFYTTLYGIMITYVCNILKRKAYRFVCIEYEIQNNCTLASTHSNKTGGERTRNRFVDFMWYFSWWRHRSSVDSPHKGPVTRSFDVLCDGRQNNRVNSGAMYVTSL